VTISAKLGVKVNIIKVEVCYPCHWDRWLLRVHVLQSALSSESASEVIYLKSSVSSAQNQCKREHFHEMDDDSLSPRRPKNNK
jgi:hypothetical protein